MARREGLHSPCLEPLEDPGCARAKHTKIRLCEKMFGLLGKYFYEIPSCRDGRARRKERGRFLHRAAATASRDFKKMFAPKSYFTVFLLTIYAWIHVGKRVGRELNMPTTIAARSTPSEARWTRQSSSPLEPLTVSVQVFLVRDELDLNLHAGFAITSCMFIAFILFHGIILTATVQKHVL